MKEPFVPKSTISEMLPIVMRQEFFRRVFGKQTLYGYKGNGNKAVGWPAYVPAEKEQGLKP